MPKHASTKSREQLIRRITAIDELDEQMRKHLENHPICPKFSHPQRSRRQSHQTHSGL